MTFEQFRDLLDDPAARGLVLLTVQRDGDVAAGWLRALEEAGLSAELHLRDAAAFSPTSSMYPTGAPLVFAIFVAPEHRERAAAALIDLGWDGRGMPGGRASGAGRSSASGALGGLRGALLALAVAAAVVVLLLATRGV